MKQGTERRQLKYLKKKNMAIFSFCWLKMNQHQTVNVPKVPHCNCFSLFFSNALWSLSSASLVTKAPLMVEVQI